MKSTTTVLSTLQSRLLRVESELNLECQNLQRLLDQKNPAVATQLKQLQSSINELHQSLNEAQQHLNEKAAATETTPPTTTEPEISPQEAAHQRHDEKITLADIFRGLLMADEPAQRDH